jgi:hypothetical protein
MTGFLIATMEKLGLARNVKRVSDKQVTAKLSG